MPAPRRGVLEREVSKSFGLAGALSVTRARALQSMSEAADARESGLDPRERIKVIGRFRPLEPGAEAAPWIVNGCTLTVPGARNCSTGRPVTGQPARVCHPPEAQYICTCICICIRRALDVRRVGAAVHV